MTEDVPSLADRIRAAAAPRRGKCGTQVLLNALPPEDRAEVEPMIVGHDIDASVIGNELRKAGYVVGDDSLRRHRNRKCTCARTAP